RVDRLDRDSSGEPHTGGAERPGAGESVASRRAVHDGCRREKARREWSTGWGRVNSGRGCAACALCDGAGHHVAPLDGGGALSRLMKRSTERILTTHTGSLPRPDDLVDMLYAAEDGSQAEEGAALADR